LNIKGKFAGVPLSFFYRQDRFKARRNQRIKLRNLALLMGYSEFFVELCGHLCFTNEDNVLSKKDLQIPRKYRKFLARKQENTRSVIWADEIF